MPSAARQAIAPLYLFACLILGGSGQGIWQNMALQLGGLALIAWAAATPGAVGKRARPLFILSVVAIGVVALQLVPLPAALWAHGSRAALADGFSLLGRAVPAEPISLAPYGSLNSLLGIIPPVAMLCAMVRLGAYRARWLVAALLAGTVAGIILGALQVATSGAASPWYFYPQTNVGLGVGFFANANHMASLLVIALPFVAAVAASAKSRNPQRDSAVRSILAGLAMLIVVGIVLNRSLAGFALALPVLAASALILIPRRTRIRKAIAVLVVLLLIGAIGALMTSATGSTRIGRDAATSVQSRQAILATTGKAIGDMLPFGSGLGTFAKVYRLYERPESVTTEYVAHAHNDYAEIALELGVPGILLLLAFLAWWVAAAAGAWQKGSPYSRAAAVASAAILVHSLVDFPLRTGAIATCFAMLLGLLIDRRQHALEESSELRPVRHLVIREAAESMPAQRLPSS